MAGITPEEAYALSRKYTKDTVEGAGAVAGKPCQIQSETPITGGRRVTFLWEDNAGTSHTTTMDVMNGADGEDGLSIQSAELDAQNHLILTMTDSSTIDAGEVPTAKGDDGKSAYEVAVEEGYVGTKEQWLASLKGDEGKSAYEVAVEQGYTGTEEEWLASLVGEDGFSPEITVKESTADKYILTIKTEDDEFDTPNLKGGGTGSSKLEELEDVTLTDLSDGQFLKYDATLEKWVNVNGVAIEKLSDISDVVLTNLKDGDIITWDAVNEQWVNIETVNGDVEEPMQCKTMPVASEMPTRIIQYIGADTTNYKRGYFYRSTPHIESGEIVYNWVQQEVQPSSQGGTEDYEELENKPQVNGVELIGDKTNDDLGIQGKIQFVTMPEANTTNRGKIIQYVGATTLEYKKGYWYTCAYDAENDEFYWQKTDVSDNAALSSAVTQLQTNQGDMSQLEVASVSDLVSAINKINAYGTIQRYEYNEPYLIIYYNDGHTFQLSVGTILNETQIGELQNVVDDTITDGQILQYDEGLRRYKPYAILTTLTALLEESKDYTDQKIAEAVVATAYVCDEKPSYDAENDTVIYKQNGVIKTTTQTDARFYYTTLDGTFCTSWIEDVEFTFSIAAVDFDDYVNKNNDVVSTYTEDMLDKTKVPNVASLDALMLIVKDYLADKLNTTDLVDNLTSQDATKALTAKQGKVLKDLVDTKNDKMQFTTMPTADIDWLAKIVQFVGTSSASYEKSQFYECKYDNDTATYYWDKVPFAADTDMVLDDTSSNPVANSVLTPEILSRAKQYSTMPTASIDNVDEIAQYIGATNTNYTNGYFYKCTLVDSDYEWVAHNTQDSVSVDGTSILKDSNDVISVSDNYKVTFKGTKAQWRALTAEQKAVFANGFVDITDDSGAGGSGSGETVDEFNPTSKAPVSSRALAYLDEWSMDVLQVIYVEHETETDYYHTNLYPIRTVRPHETNIYKVMFPRNSGKLLHPYLYKKNVITGETHGAGEIRSSLIPPNTNSKLFEVYIIVHNNSDNEYEVIFNYMGNTSGYPTNESISYCKYNNLDNASREALAESLVENPLAQAFTINS